MVINPIPKCDVTSSGNVIAKDLPRFSARTLPFYSTGENHVASLYALLKSCD